MIRLLRSLDLPFFSPGRAKKRHSFHCCEFGRREALSIPEARRGAEASTACFSPRRAAQAGWTEGAERSLEFAGKGMPKERTSRRLPLFGRAGVAGRNRPAWKRMRDILHDR